MQNWDDIYDPSRPNNYEDYKHSEEKYREIKDWKDRLYAHRFVNKARSDDYSDESDTERPTMSSMSEIDTRDDISDIVALLCRKLCSTFDLFVRSPNRV